MTGTTWAWLGLVVLAAIFGRPLLEFAWVVGMRVAEAASLRFGGPVWRPPRAQVVERATSQADEIDGYLRALRAGAPPGSVTADADFSSEAAYARSIAPARARLEADLGYPPPGFGAATGEIRETVLASDTLATYIELQVPVLPGVNSTGIYMVPKAASPGGKLPLVIAGRGRGSAPGATPDGTADFILRSARDTAYGALLRGYAVWLPGFVYYGEDRPEDLRERLAISALQSGTSLPAIEIAKTVKAIDALVQRPEIDASRIAMTGMSYGAFYALYTAALEPRIRAVVVAAYFNDRAEVLDASAPYGYLDWRFPNSLRHWKDPDVVALVCPRALLIQSGNQDQLFPIAGARRAAPIAAMPYEKLGLRDRFVFSEFIGRHEFAGSEAWDFVERQFRQMAG